MNIDGKLLGLEAQAPIREDSLSAGRARISKKVINTRTLG